MKFFMSLLLSLSASSISFADVIIKEMPITVNDVLLPSKVDSLTDVKVVVSGLFPNTCYNWSRGEVVNKGALEHQIRAMAFVSQTMCLMVLVPYTREINLGQFQRGEHILRFVNGDETYFEKTVTVN